MFLNTSLVLNGSRYIRDRIGTLFDFIESPSRGFQKGVRETLSQIPEGFTIAVQDESIFVHDNLLKENYGCQRE